MLLMCDIGYSIQTYLPDMLCGFIVLEATLVRLILNGNMIILTRLLTRSVLTGMGIQLIYGALGAQCLKC